MNACDCVGLLILHLKTTLPALCLCSSQVLASLARPPLISSSLSHSSFVLFIPFNHGEKELAPSPPPAPSCLSLDSQQCHTDSSVLRLSLRLCNEFCLGHCSLAFALGPKRGRGEGRGRRGKEYRVTMCCCSAGVEVDLPEFEQNSFHISKLS